MDDVLEQVALAIGHHFEDNQLLTEALHAAGIVRDQAGIWLPREGNKRLALLGYAVMRLALTHLWYPTVHSRGKR